MRNVQVALPATCLLGSLDDAAGSSPRLMRLSDERLLQLTLEPTSLSPPGPHSPHQAEAGTQTSAGSLAQCPGHVLWM